MLGRELSVSGPGRLTIFRDGSVELTPWPTFLRIAAPVARFGPGELAWVEALGFGVFSFRWKTQSTGHFKRFQAFTPRRVVEALHAVGIEVKQRGSFSLGLRAFTGVMGGVGDDRAINGDASRVP
jgi:hypothetical protein